MHKIKERAVLVQDMKITQGCRKDILIQILYLIMQFIDWAIFSMVFVITINIGFCLNQLLQSLKFFRLRHDIYASLFTMSRCLRGAAFKILSIVIILLNFTRLTRRNFILLDLEVLLHFIIVLFISRFASANYYLCYLLLIWTCAGVNLQVL